MPGIDAIGGQAVELLEFADFHTVGAGDFPQGITAFDDVGCCRNLTQAQFLADQDPVSFDAVDVLEGGQLKPVAQGNPRQRLSVPNDVNTLILPGRPDSQLLSRQNAVLLQSIELSQQSQADVEAQGDFRKGVAQTDDVFAYLLVIGRG